MSASAIGPPDPTYDRCMARAVYLMTMEDQPPMADPIIYDLANDAHAARFGLTPAERDRLLGNRFEMRSGHTPKAIVLHIQDGITAGSLDWWVNGPGIQASATVMAQKDGSILRVIPERHGPWTNGDVIAPTAIGRRIAALAPNPNMVSLTIEAEGRPWDAMPPAQLAAIAWQVNDWQRRYGISIANVIRHAELNSVSRANCPGLYYPAVIKALAPPVTPTEPVPGGIALPPGMDAALAADWFGEVVKDGRWFRFDANGGVTKLWVAHGMATGEWPALVDVGIYKDSATSTRRFFRFSSGLTFVHVTGQPVRVVKAA